MKIRILAFFTAALSFLGAKPQAHTLTDEQRSVTIYQIMTASFQRAENGVPGYTAMWGPDGERKDGNLRGIINALPYIKELGANAIWITPVFDSSKSDIDEKLKATGYFANNYFAIDPHFGTDQDIRELIDKAHELGLYVFFDGVFGHHGGVTEPSPSGYRIDTRFTENDRNDGPGNVAYPGSLDYYKDVAAYWIREYGIDGWRLDQAYQLLQNGKNYWTEIRKTIEDAAAERRAKGEKWGTLGFTVAEDWGPANVINSGVFSDNGMVSAFDFDGKERISGPMQKFESAGLENGWDDVITTLLPPRQRGYLNDSVAPLLYVTNHDGYRLADHFDPGDEHYYEKQMARFAILGAYNGPISIYYGDEYADRSVEKKGAQPDNIARTSGHLEPRNPQEKILHDYVADVLAKRRENPAMWRGKASFTKQDVGDARTLTVTKTDEKTGNVVHIVFSDKDTTVPVRGFGGVDVDAWRPEIVVAKKAE
ncbi:MAG: alpha-amylase family protein [Bacteroidales bacterium]|nr:alpha-amylase family protein [Bacteroidales bacterium]